MSPAASNSAELVSSPRAIDGEASSVRDAPWSVGEQSESGVKSSFGLDEPPPQAQIAIPPHVRAQTGPPPLSSSSGAAETTGTPPKCVERPGGAGQRATAPPPGSPPRARARVAATRTRACARRRAAGLADGCGHARRAARERRRRRRPRAAPSDARRARHAADRVGRVRQFLPRAHRRAGRGARLGRRRDRRGPRARTPGRGGRACHHTARARPGADGTCRRDAASPGRGGATARAGRAAFAPTMTTPHSDLIGKLSRTALDHARGGTCGEPQTPRAANCYSIRHSRVCASSRSGGGTLTNRRVRDAPPRCPFALPSSPVCMYRSGHTRRCGRVAEETRGRQTTPAGLVCVRKQPSAARAPSEAGARRPRARTPHAAAPRGRTSAPRGTMSSMPGAIGSTSWSRSSAMRNASSPSW